MSNYSRKSQPLRSAVLAAAGLSCAALYAGPVAAQQDGAAVLEEILVTARLREESAQDIGQSIRAFSGRELEEAGIIDFADIARRTPGLDFTNRGPNANELSIRGVAKLANGAVLDIIGTLPVVSQFLDEIPFQAGTSRQRDIHAFDLDRVEVLKGPQPTYFGEGSVGGTVRYFSKDPSLEEGFRGKLNVNLSSTADGGDNYTINGAFEATLIPDVLGIRVMGYSRDDEGFVDNLLTNNEDFNFYESQGGRISVLAQPTEDLRIRAVAHFADDEDGGDWLADDTSDDSVLSLLPIDTERSDDYELYSLTIDYDFDKFRFTSVTGYYEREIETSRYDFTQALNSLPVLFGFDGDVVNESTSRSESFSQEFRLISNFDGPVNFLAGVFFIDSDGYGSALARSPQLAATNAFGNVLLGIPAPGSDLFFGTAIETGPSTREQTAVFGEITWEINEQTRLIAGARWLDEELVSPLADPELANEPFLAFCILAADFTPTVAYPNNPCIASILLDANSYLGLVGLDASAKFSNEVDGEILPRFAVEYDLSEDMLLYAGISKGLRNGGLNSAFVVGFASEIGEEDIGYDPDELWAYELGFKSVLNDGALILNASVFYNDWDDVQTLISTSAGSLFENAGRAESMGFDVDALWKANDWLTLSGAMNYTKSEFKDEQIWETPLSQAISELLGRPPNIIADGNRLPNVPEMTFSLAADVLYPTAWEGISFTGHFDWQYMDERYQSSVNAPQDLLDDYSLMNVRFGLSADNWSAIAYISNLADERAEQYRFQLGAGAATTGAYLNRPRTIGLNLTFEF